MNSKSTLRLVAAALGLLLYILLVERRLEGPEAAAGQPQRLFPEFDPAKVTSIEILRSDHFIRVERTNEQWRLVHPPCPAQSTAIENWLSAFGALNRRAWISAQELLAQPGGLAAFGLDEPRATVTLQYGDKRLQLHLGEKTPVGEKLYLQRVGSDGVLVTESLLADRLPHSVLDWRDPAFLNLAGLNFDRLHVRAGSRGDFEFERPGGGRPWRLKSPRSARADNMRLEQLFQRLQTARVSQFVTDVPGGDLELYGLQAPELVVTFAQGTNQLLVVEFGKALTNNPSLLFARRSSNPSIVAVPKQTVELLRVSYTEFLDRHLVEVSPEAVGRVEVRALERFTLQRQTNGVWRVEEPIRCPADPALVQGMFGRLNALQILAVKEVVTPEDLPNYGLAPPSSQYILHPVVSPGATNAPLAQIDFGTNQNGQVFVRRSDENSVYTTSLEESVSLPQAAFELRDRRIWSFTTNEVAGVTITLKGQAHKLLRSEGGKWKFAEGSLGMVTSFALEEAIFRLGHLRAMAWVAQGENRSSRYGFAEAAHKLAIELRDGEKAETLSVEFGGPSLSGGPYAAVHLEGGQTVFEFPAEIFLAYSEAVRHLAGSAGGSQ